MQVEIEVSGLRYVGEVHETDGLITVMTDAGGMEMTTLGGQSLEQTARNLLRRLVKTGKAHPCPVESR